MIDLTSEILLILFLAACFAGFVDSIAGGGGLITIPVLLLAGIPPLESIATNKLQSQFAAASATIAYARRGHVDLRSQMPMALTAAVGGAAGALLASVVPAGALAAAIPFVLIAVALFFAVKPNLADVDSQRRVTAFAFTLTVIPVVGLYDGLFGPGAGSFYMLAFVLLAGFGMLKATAHTKLINFGSNFGSFLVFAATGSLLWKVGLVMGAGQFLGAQVGSRLAMKQGAKVIKPLLILSCLALAAKLLSDPTHPLRLWLGF